MRQIIALLLLSTLLSSVLSSIVPCGKCLGRGDVCSSTRTGSCGDNLKCASSQGNANLCFPVFEQGEKCTSVGEELSACESGFFCNRTGTGNCDRSASGARGDLNDGCVDDTWCGFGLNCQGGLCKVGTTTGRCSSDLHCPAHQYCDNTNGCVGRTAEGGNCATSQCHPTLYCDYTNIANPVCKAYYINEENSNCTDTSQCKPGFICDCIVGRPTCIKNCIRPTYFLLGGYGAAWGQDCDPSDNNVGTGCRCNYDAKIYMYLKEVSQTYLDACPGADKEFYKCLEVNSCVRANLAPKSCYRTKCYHFHSLLRTACSSVPPSLVPPICSAQGIAAMFTLLVTMLLL